MSNLRNDFFALDKQSKLTLDRRKFLHDLAIESDKIQNPHITSGHNADDGSLRMEAIAVQEVLRCLIALSEDRYFYENMDKAFSLLVKEKPGSVSSYAYISKLTRTFEKHSDIIYAKLIQMEGIEEDLCTLEREDMDRCRPTQKVSMPLRKIG